MKIVEKTMTVQEVMEKQVMSRSLMVTLVNPMQCPHSTKNSIALSEDSLETSELSASGVVESEDDEYLVRTYRALSETIIDCYGIDFRKDGVLKAALPLFKGTEHNNVFPVYKDHGRSIDDWLGKANDAYFDESSDPKGVNQVLAFDKIACGEKVVRGVKTRALNCVSVTVSFDWEKSHPELEDDIFFRKWWKGESVDGRRCLVVATKITAVKETSLVWKGADSTATARQSEEEKEKMDNEMSLSEGVKQEETKQEETKQEETKQEEKNQEQNDVNDPAYVSARLSEMVESLKVKVEELQAKANISAMFMDREKKQLAAFVALTMDKAGADATMSMADSLDPEKLMALTESYRKKADALYYFQCGKCGSHDVSRQSSVKPTAENEAGTDDDGVSNKAKELANIKREFNRKRVQNRK